MCPPISRHTACPHKCGIEANIASPEGRSRRHVRRRAHWNVLTRATAVLALPENYMQWVQE